MVLKVFDLCATDARKELAFLEYLCLTIQIDLQMIIRHSSDDLKHILLVLESVFGII